ncbi:MAG: SEC-C domain-containing protein, partial [Candidatus Cloacimonetes bacterium]|nr:SEC-C domain-containing protein [Candidatus Cloacimonadota bacterium]MDY0230790.1 SEC-C metal-binding domain-containing protein [Candidatus Cloacimonadaceae bacterium]
DNRSYLIQEIKKIFPEAVCPCRNEFEILRAIHMIEIYGFISHLRRDIIDDPTISHSVLKLDIEQTSALIKYLNGLDGYSLKELQSLIYKMLNEFIEVYPFLIPAFSTQFYKENSVDFEIEGSTTSTFDSVKQFYLNAYETLGTLMVLPISLNNIKYRSKYDSIMALGNKVKSLDDFIGSTKANRFHFCDETELFTEYLHIKVNSKLRNAIGHNDVDYDPITQQITYIPNPKDRSKKETAYLLEFENEALRLFQAILVISEYLYKLREVDLINQGNIPINPNTPFKRSKKIGRNDKCSCGSGLKYKFCHGR